MDPSNIFYFLIVRLFEPDIHHSPLCLSNRQSKRYQYVVSFATYSSVPNRRAGRNKPAGGKILKKTLNVQDRIDVQGGFFSQN